MSCRLIFSSLLTIAFISGCSTSKVLSIDKNTHIVSSSGAGFDTGAVRENVYKAANNFCAEKGEDMKTLSYESIRGKMASHPPSAELKFKCVKISE